MFVDPDLTVFFFWDFMLKANTKEVFLIPIQESRFKVFPPSVGQLITTQFLTQKKAIHLVNMSILKKNIQHAANFCPKNHVSFKFKYKTVL